MPPQTRRRSRSPPSATEPYVAKSNQHKRARKNVPGAATASAAVASAVAAARHPPALRISAPPHERDDSLSSIRRRSTDISAAGTDAVTSTGNLSTQGEQISPKKETNDLGKQNEPLSDDQKRLEVEKERLEEEKKGLKKDKERLEKDKERLEKYKERLEKNKERLEKDKERLEKKEERLEERESDLTAKISAARTKGNERDAAHYESVLSKVGKDKDDLREKERINRAERKSTAESLASMHAALPPLCSRGDTIQKQIADVSKRLQALSEPNRAGNISWALWEQGKQLAHELLSLPAVAGVDRHGQQSGSGVEFTRLTKGIDLDGTRSPVLVTRRHTRGVSRAILRWLNTRPAGSRAVLTGAPGIGKTRTLLFMLMLLLRDGKNVMYANRKENIYVWWKLSSDGKYEVTRCRHSTIDPTFEVSSGDWLLSDPTEDGNDVKTCQGYLILAASANRKHFHNWMKDETEFFYLNQWSEEELLAARNEMGGSALSDEVVRHRFLQVGGAPRYIFDERKYYARLRSITNKAEKLDYDMVKKLFENAPSSQVDDGSYHLSATFLAYELGDDCEKLETFTDWKVVFVSQFALYAVVQHKLMDAYDKVVGNSNPAQATFYGAVFEDVALSHICLGGKFQTKKLLATRRPAVLKGNVVLKESKAVLTASNEEMYRMLERPLRRGEEQGLVYVGRRNFGAIDFADSTGRLFNATVNVHHGMSAGAMKRVVAAALRGRPTSLTRRKRPQLELYWCVPATIKSKYGEMRKKISDDMAKDLRCDVEEYLLLIPRKAQVQGRVLFGLAEKLCA